MIDWFGVFNNALWIFGLAIVLAALSYADWRRRLAVPKESFRQALAGPGFQAALSLGYWRVRLEPDVANAFPTENAVNEALRLVMKMAQLPINLSHNAPGVP